MRDYYSVNEMEEMYGIEWNDLAKLEPELENLLRWARMVGNSCRKWTDVENGFAQFKNDIAELAVSAVGIEGTPLSPHAARMT